MPVVTEILKDEHRILERMLRVFERHLQSLEKGGGPPSEVFKNMLHFFRTYAHGCHQRKEETLLFPKLVERGFAWDVGPIGAMLADHDLSYNELGGCAEGIRLYTVGDRRGREVLLRHGRRFITVLRDHIRTEEAVLFVMADSHFTERDQEELTAAFSAIQDDLTSCQASRGLIAMVEGHERRDTTTAEA